jgi:hypothetical protein
MASEARGGRTKYRYDQGEDVEEDVVFRILVVI